MATLRDGDTSEQKWLLPLIGIAVALGCWMLADTVREQTLQLANELPAQNPQSVRNAAEAMARMQARAASARSARTEVEQALQVDDPLPLLETRFVHALRQRCLAAGVQSCVVKFSGSVTRSASVPASAPTGAGNRSALADKTDAVVSLEDLGLAKARAIVSGSFQTKELLDFVASIRNDREQHWRINGLVVKANNFELDVELLLREPGSAGPVNRP